MFTVLDNPAALSSFAQIVPDNKGVVLAAQDNSAAQRTNVIVVGAVSASVVLVLLFVIVMLRSKRKRSRVR